jgi:hypothetical protein
VIDSVRAGIEATLGILQSLQDDPVSVGAAY